MSRPLLALLAAVVVSGCGARSSLRDDAPDARAGTPDAVAGADVQTPTDTCVVGPAVPISMPGAPAFAFSLDEVAAPESGYVIGASSGWPPDERAQVVRIDAELRPLGSQSLVGGRAHAGAAGSSGRMLVAYGPDRLALVARVRVSASDVSTEGEGRLCDGCVTSWSSPIQDGARGAVVTTATTFDRWTLRVFHRERLEMLAAGADTMGAGPVLVPMRDGMLVLYQLGERLRAARYDWDARPGNDVDLSVGPLRMRVAATRSDDGRTFVVAPTREASRNVLAVLELGDDGAVARTLPLPDAVGVENGFSTRAQRGSLAVAWGENAPAERAGAHLVVVDRAGVVRFGPMRISERLPNSASHTIWAALAPHPAGYAVVYGAWQPGTGNGLYGRIVRCPVF